MSGPILVFGAAGQVGQELLHLAQSKSIACVGVTREQADITSADAVGAAIAQARPRLVVNAAAYTAVDRAESEPDLADAVNADAAAIVARAAAAAGVPLVHLSTDYVFDGSKAGPYREDDPVAPLGAYGRSKLKGETLVRAAHADAIILRTAWVYGRYGNNFLKTMLRLAATNDRLRVVADQFGCPTSTVDIAEAILAIDQALSTGHRAAGIFHFVAGPATSWHQFAETIVACQAEWTKARPPVDAITTADYPTPARRPANSVLDTERFESTFGYRAMPWPDRTRQTIDAMLASSASGKV